MNKLDRKAIFLLAAESLFDLDCSAQEFEEYSLTLLRLGKSIEKQERKSAELDEYQELLEKQAHKMRKELQNRIAARRADIQSITDVEELLKLKSEEITIKIVEEMRSEQFVKAIEHNIRNKIMESIGIIRHDHHTNRVVSYSLDNRSELYSTIAKLIKPVTDKMNADLMQYARSGAAKIELESGLDTSLIVNKFANAYKEELLKKIEGTWSDQVKVLTNSRLQELKMQAESNDPAVAMELLTYILSLQVKF